MLSRPQNAEYACALIMQDGKILLGRRAHFRATYPSCWDVIGGRIEPGETAEQTLARELQEELAITPRHPRACGTLKDPGHAPETAPLYRFFVVDTWDGGTPRLNNHEHSHLAWFTAQQACDLSNLALEEYRTLLHRVLISNEDAAREV